MEGILGAKQKKKKKGIEWHEHLLFITQTGVLVISNSFHMNQQNILKISKQAKGELGYTFHTLTMI